MGSAPSTRLKGRRATADAFSTALKLLAARPKSRAALVTQLEARGFPMSEILAAVARCEELNYLREAEVALGQARALLQAGHAPASVVARLGAKEFPEALVQKAVADAVRELAWNESRSAQQLLVKKKLKGAKAVRFLLTHGYEEDVARRAAGFDEA